MEKVIMLEQRLVLKSEHLLAQRTVIKLVSYLVLMLVMAMVEESELK